MINTYTLQHLEQLLQDCIPHTRDLQRMVPFRKGKYVLDVGAKELTELTRQMMQ